MATDGATSSTYTGNNVNSPTDVLWRRHLPWVRVGLAAIVAVMAFLSDGRLSASVALLSMYVIVSGVGAVRGGGQRGLLGMLALFADTVYFLIVVYFGGARIEWLAAAFFLYLLTEALVFSGPVEVGVISAVSAIFCSVLPIPEMRGLESMVVVAGALSCGFAVYLRRQGAVEHDLTVKLAAALKAVEKESRGREPAHRGRFPRRSAAEFHQSADAAGDSAQAAGARSRGRHAGLTAVAGAGAIAGTGFANVPAQHAAGGYRRRESGGDAAADGGVVSERERDSGGVRQHVHPGGTCRPK